MAASEINLIAPNSLPIIGIKLMNGSVSPEFKYFYDIHKQISDLILPEGACSPSVLVDSAGNEWDVDKVEDYSLFQLPPE